MGALSRQKILETAATLFTQQGYKGTSMDDIASACQVKKSSLYHHIQSRKTLVLEVLEETLSKLRAYYVSVIYNEETSLAERLAKLLAPSENLFTAMRLVDTLWHEVAREVPEIKGLVRGYLTAWADAIAFLLCSRYGEACSKKLAEEAIAQLYGAFIYEDIFQDRRLFISLVEQMTGLLTEPKRNALFHSGGLHVNGVSFD